MNKRKIFILVSILVFVIVTPIFYSQARRIFNRNSLESGGYTIESVECTDRFGNSITLMVKPSLNIRYEVFPEVINPLDNITYYDKSTYYSCFGEREGEDPVTTFTFSLDIMVKQNRKSQKISYTAIAIFGAGRWSESFWFDKLGGELLITFRLLGGVQR
ncbi:MAG: hypothetical protein JJE41_12610 [Candidatus Heimdallarchaeota archaeon]|nr:hypothetical protein [Candidatus Heimdallarchaeota archaeon]